MNKFSHIAFESELLGTRPVRQYIQNGSSPQLM